jgi:hypothetical protein
MLSPALACGTPNPCLNERILASAFECGPVTSGLTFERKEMTSINSDFKKGDVVYAAGSIYQTMKVSCPDCLVTLKWTIIFADEAVD